MSTEAQPPEDVEARSGFRFVKGELADREALAGLFAEERFEIVVFLQPRPVFAIRW